MTPADQARLLLRKAAQDQAVLEKLIKALLGLGGHDYPRSHDLSLLLDLLASVGLQLPEEFLVVDTLTPFATLYRYDDLPLEEAPDPRDWPQLLRALERPSHRQHPGHRWVAGLKDSLSLPEAAFSQGWPVWGTR
jgi:hypothetical protein